MKNTINELTDKAARNDLKGYREIFEKNLNYFNTVCQKEHVEEVEEKLKDAEYNEENDDKQTITEELKLCTEKLGSYEISSITNIL